ncbi:MAG: hypothetical protein ACLTU1_18990, partial [Blautia wexlerae]
TVFAGAWDKGRGNAADALHPFAADYLGCGLCVPGISSNSSTSSPPPQAKFLLIVQRSFSSSSAVAIILSFPPGSSPNKAETCQRAALSVLSAAVRIYLNILCIFLRFF